MQITFTTELVNERIEKLNSFFFTIDKLINWEEISYILNKSIRNHLGADGYDLLSMFKVILLQQWYCLSDRAMEENLLDRLSFMMFCGFTLESKVPDHSSICRFRNSIIEHKLEKKLFSEINRQIESYGFSLKKGSIVDASLIKSYCKPQRTEYIEVEPVGDEDPSMFQGEKGKYKLTKEDKKDIKFVSRESKDPDARWIKRGKRSVFGYKAHLSVDIENGMIQNIESTAANMPDVRQFRHLIKGVILEKGSEIQGDKGYASRDNVALIIKKGCKPGIMHKKYKNDKEWEIKNSLNKAISQIRYKVERTFGNLHLIYGISKTPYIGNRKTDYFLKMKGIAYNLKRFIKIQFA